MNVKFKASQVRSLVASRLFFCGIILLLIIQSAWITLTGRYPMAFDEDFHLGIIRLYAHHISPFWSGQPAGANAFGAVARDPSYFYQYLMSFPYRLIDVFTHDQTIQVIILRFIDIGLFAVGLIIMRKLLLKTGAGRAIVHLCLLAFVLIPVVSQLAAQINYDNLLLPLTAWSLLLAVNVGQQLSRKQVDSGALVGLLTLCLFASLVKYAFLPIFAAILLYLLVLAVKAYRRQGRSALISQITASWRALSRRAAWLLAAGFILMSGLFAERYFLNIVHYHTPVPGCGKVLSVQQCSAYGPWIRDYNFAINKVDEERSPFVFTADWFYGMWLRLFFAVDGPATQFETRGPLLLPAIGSVATAALGLIVFAVFAKKVYQRYNHPALWLFALIIVFYVGALWLDEYLAYVHTGQPVAINGRYLFPVMLPAILLMALAFKEWLWSHLNYQLLLAAVVLISLIWGGGGLTYILRSNDSWYWNSQITRDANQAVKSVVGPVAPGYYSPTLFMR